MSAAGGERGPVADRDANVARLLGQRAAEHPGRACVTDLDAPGGPRTVTYAGLADRVGRLAAGLAAAGLSPGDRVAVLLRNSTAYVETFLAVAAAGLVLVPLNVRLRPEDYAHMLADSGARLLVTEGALADRVPGGIAVVTTDGPGRSLDDLAASGAGTGPVPRAGEDVLSLMYTSGTTGAPKAVMLTHRSWRSVADLCSRALGFGPGEAVLHVAPLTHGSGFLLLPTLMAGGRTVLCGSFDPARTAALIGSEGVTGMFLVPSMIRMLLDALPPGWRAPASFRRLYYAGSPIDPDTLREAVGAFDGRLVQSFAQMESPMLFTVLDPGDHRRAAAPDGALLRSAGRVLPEVALRIVDEAGADLPPGRPGQILARAPQTMAGYWGRPEETAAALHEGWLHTGDVGYLDPQGYLHVVDRIKDMVVTGGSNVYAGEVEDVLLGLPQVRAAAVVGTPHRVWGEAVTAVLVSTDGSRDSDGVLAGCRARLADYRVPKRVVWVDELPRNAYGKVLKRELRERFADPGGG